ncbi:putative wing apart-like protein [Plasmopara halstedii]
MRKLCHLSLESVELFVQHGIVATVAHALQTFPDDAILQASACGCFAVLTQVSDVSKNEMLAMDEPNIMVLMRTSLDAHRDYSNLTRQVQIYACEGIEFLNNYIDRTMRLWWTISSIGVNCFRSSTKSESIIELAVSLFRQGITREDKKVTCSLCSFLLCLTSHSSFVAESLRALNAIADISVVIAKYPMDEDKGGNYNRQRTSSHHQKSLTVRPKTSSGIVESSSLHWFDQPQTLERAKTQSSVTSSIQLLDKSRGIAPKPSRLPPPRSRDEHLRRAGDMKRRKRESEQRDRLLIQTYGSPPLILKEQLLGNEEVTFVIPPPLSSIQSQDKLQTRSNSSRLTPLVQERIKISNATLPNSGNRDSAFSAKSSGDCGNRPTAVVVKK